MGSDVFRFDALLKIRENLRDERHRDLAALDAQKALLLDEILRLSNDSANNLSQWSAAQRQSPPDTRLLARFGVRQKKIALQKETKNAELEQLDGKIAEQTALFEEAVRDVRILENLRERKLQERLNDERDHERKRLDEIGSKPS